MNGVLKVFDGQEWKPTGVVINQDITQNNYNYGRNLLDNWYFVGGGSQQGGGQFPINQRGQTSYTEAGYGIDRWKKTTGTSATLLVTENGLSASNAKAFLRQFYENKSDLVAKKLTASILLKNRGLFSITLENMTVDQRFVFDGEVLSVETVPTGYPNEIFGLYANLDDYIIAVKLEIGSQQTLAHQENGQWVLNEIPDYGEQLARCRWHYRKYIVFIGNVFYPNAIDTGIYANDMRVPPAVSCSGVNLPGGQSISPTKYTSRDGESIWLDMPAGTFPTMGVGVYIKNLELNSEL